MMHAIAFTSLCTFLVVANGSPIGITVTPGGVLSGQGDGTPNKAIGTGKLYDGEPIWGDLVGSTFQNVPDWMKGFRTSLPSHRMKEGTVIQFHCAEAAQTGFDYCDAYAFIYRCHGCEFEDGYFSSFMLGHGYTPFRCVPAFEVGGPNHRFQGFTKTIPAGATETVVLVAPITEYVALAVNHNGIACEALDETTCNANGKCFWDGVACYTSLCNSQPFQVGPHQPPQATCSDHCIAVDLPEGHDLKGQK